MTHFIKKGNTFWAADEEALDLHKKLPVGTFTVKLCDAGYYYERIDDLTLPDKLYGNINKLTERILNTFHQRDGSTGVLLVGEKGSGKTLQAKALSVMGRDIDLTTIIINSPYHGEAFNTFIQSLEQPAMILFDEFEKVYGTEEQQAVLTLLDGTYPTKKLFIITSNNRYRIDEHMRNRPGRLYYSINYDGLGRDFIKEYAEDNLNDVTQVEGLLRIVTLFDKFSFDMLQTFVEEMNRYKETAAEVINIINAKPEFSGDNRQHYKVKAFLEDDNVELPVVGNGEWFGNPFTQPVNLNYIVTKTGKILDEDEIDNLTEKVLRGIKYHALQLESKDIVKVDGERGHYVYKKDGHIVTLEKKSDAFDYSKFF